MHRNNEGMPHENAIAQELAAHGRKLYYILPDQQAKKRGLRSVKPRSIYCSAEDYRPNNFAKKPFFLGGSGSPVLPPRAAKPASISASASGVKFFFNQVNCQSNVVGRLLS